MFALSKTTIHWNQLKKIYKTKNNQRKTLKKKPTKRISNKNTKKTKKKQNQQRKQENKISGLSVSLKYKLIKKTTLHKCSGTIQWWIHNP